MDQYFVNDLPASDPARQQVGGTWAPPQGMPFAPAVWSPLPYPSSPRPVYGGPTSPRHVTPVIWLAALGALVAVVLLAAGGLRPSTRTVATDPCCSRATGQPPTPVVVTKSPQEIDVQTISAAILGYYEGAGGRLTLEKAGSSWRLLDADRRVLKSGPLMQPDEIVVSTEVDGPATWCVALGRTGGGSPSWSADSQGEMVARACPQTTSYT